MSLTVLLAVAFVGAALYYVCPLRLRWVLLLLLSYGFYLTCGLSALPFIALTTLTTWAGALVIARVGESGKAYLRAHKAELTAEAKKAQKARTRSRQRVWFFAVLLLNFGVLAVLKYLNPVMAWGASLLGGSAPSLGLVLPLGISFYTFQSMGYLIDVYNGKYAPEKNPAKFALFVSFFPQLIQGPIARFDQLESQLVTPHRFDLDGIERGLLLMLWGWFKKKVIADRALSLVEAVFGNQNAYGGAVIVVGVLFYSLQQYADFSGGIDLVTGIAQLFGIQLAPNFKRPYFSVSLGDFWRRWHISLGSWFRDYVYIPLGGSRVRLGRWVLNLLVVWGLTGLWHGAAWTFVLWGLYFAVFLLLEKLFLGRLLRRLPVLRHVYVLTAALFSFVLFDASSLSAAIGAAGAMLGLGHLPVWDGGTLYYLHSYAPVLLAAAVGSTPLPAVLCRRMAAGRAGRVLDALEPIALLALLAVCTAFLVSGSANPFLYFRF